jgi:hypothetical protein
MPVTLEAFVIWPLCFLAAFLLTKSVYRGAFVGGTIGTAVVLVLVGLAVYRIWRDPVFEAVLSSPFSSQDLYFAFHKLFAGLVLTILGATVTGGLGAFVRQGVDARRARSQSS